ncbi:uncharacterized protein LOC131316063 isoform X1 [Rhododendron vialii]|uniref:uncharacterized protein LOC131316063 isoform X1 n=1 Tax=Rhododendron vialii TaxID=182163 RepID=UPI00265F8E60|nr:uncharacterized protein LOC131316063 isoform X1 [Rhododendron vialii]
MRVKMLNTKHIILKFKMYPRIRIQLLDTCFPILSLEICWVWMDFTYSKRKYLLGDRISGHTLTQYQQPGQCNMGKFGHPYKYTHKRWKGHLSACLMVEYVKLLFFQIYVSLEGVDQEKMEIVFKPMSIDVKFHDVQGKNYRCAIPKLNKEIVPEKCKVVVKPTRVIITLPKASKGNWLDLHFKEDKLKPNVDKGGDPMAGIMDLMKNMYEEGDDEMKKTIAKAWTDARSGKAADPLKDYR